MIKQFTNFFKTPEGKIAAAFAGAIGSLQAQELTPEQINPPAIVINVEKEEANKQLNAPELKPGEQALRPISKEEYQKLIQQNQNIEAQGAIQAQLAIANADNNNGIQLVGNGKPVKKKELFKMIENGKITGFRSSKKNKEISFIVKHGGKTLKVTMKNKSDWWTFTATDKQGRTGEYFRPEDQYNYPQSLVNAKKVATEKLVKGLQKANIEVLENIRSNDEKNEYVAIATMPRSKKSKKKEGQKFLLIVQYYNDGTIKIDRKPISKKDVSGIKIALKGLKEAADAGLLKEKRIKQDLMNHMGNFFGRTEVKEDQVKKLATALNNH